MTVRWLISILGLVAFVVGSFLLVHFALPWVLPFVIALLLAELMDPLITLLTKKGRLPRSIAVVVVLLVFIGLVVVGATALVARLVSEIAVLIDKLPYLYPAMIDMGNRFAEQFGAFHASLPVAVQRIMTDTLNGVQERLKELLPVLMKTLGSISSLPAFLTNSLITLIATFFISRDKRLIFDFLLKLFPAPWRPKLQKVKEDVWTSAMGWAKAQAMLITMTMVMSMIGLSLIGANYAVLVGLIVALVDILPLVGTAMVYLPWAAYCLLTGGTAFGIKLLVLYGVVAGVRQVLEPKLVGEQLGLHPLAILVSIYLGFEFFGALGFVVGPLLAILLKAMLKSGLLPTFEE